MKMSIIDFNILKLNILEKILNDSEDFDNEINEINKLDEFSKSIFRIFDDGIFKILRSSDYQEHISSIKIFFKNLETINFPNQKVEYTIHDIKQSMGNLQLNEKIDFYTSQNREFFEPLTEEKISELQDWIFKGVENTKNIQLITKQKSFLTNLKGEL